MSKFLDHTWKDVMLFQIQNLAEVEKQAAPRTAETFDDELHMVFTLAPNQRDREQLYHTENRLYLWKNLTLNENSVEF